MDMLELDWEHVFGLAEAAMRGGWSGLLALSLAAAAALGIILKRMQSRNDKIIKENAERRETAKAENKKINRKSEAAHAAAEQEIEDLIKEFEDADRS